MLPVRPSAYLPQNETEQQRRAKEQQEQARRAQNLQFYGTEYGMGNPEAEQAFMAGDVYGRRLFRDDPEMQELLAKRKDLAQGYDGATLGALRGIARGEIAGNQAANLSALRSSAARGGVSGARGAAMEGAARQKFAGQTADAERKMMLDQAQEIRRGNEDLEKFIFNQRYGQTGTAAAFGQGALARQAADAQREAARGGRGNSWICTAIHKQSPFTMPQMKHLLKLRYKAAEIMPDDLLLYLDKGNALVKRMEMEQVDFTYYKPKVLEIIKLFKEDQEKGVQAYKEFALGLNMVFGE